MAVRSLLSRFGRTLGLVAASSYALLDDALFLAAVGTTVLASLVAYGAARLIATARTSR